MKINWVLWRDYGDFGEGFCKRKGLVAGTISIEIKFKMNMTKRKKL